MKNKILRMFSLFSLLLVAITAGCGSDRKEGSGQSETFRASAACIECHAVNKISPVTGGTIVTEWQRSAHNTQNGAACTACHINNGHPQGGSIIKAVPDTQCQTCHTVVRLGTPHFSNFTTSLAAQYISQTDAPEVQCRQCHNPHDTTTLLQYNRDWADSGHGSTKYVPGDANASSVNSHYPWTTASRDVCSKCHTTSGYKKVSSGAASVLTTTNTTTNTSTTTVTPNAPLMSNNKKNETIMCSACHINYSWTRRVIGAQTLEYTYDSDLVPGGGSDPFAGPAPATVDGLTAAAAVVLPNIGDSNLCVVCHSGRGNFQSVRSSRFEGHHAPTGADLYADLTHVGFEFDGRVYTKPAFFAHPNIGLTTGAGPCVSCHMKSTKSHTFEVVTKNTSGTITAINSQAVCNGCHSDMTPATLNQEALGYRQAGKLLTDYLDNIVPNKPNYTGAAILRATTPQINALHVNTYGAVQNSLLVTEDPGGYTHNRFYLKRLLFDSIDWLDNHVFDGTITIDAAVYPNAAAWFNAAAGTGIATRP
ncbi:cytochrome c3 family protein [Pelotalea chapellei]|nr:cytochrome c3 family protein [Pelotalea chapellei]